MNPSQDSLAAGFVVGLTLGAAVWILTYYTARRAVAVQTGQVVGRLVADQLPSEVGALRGPIVAAVSSVTTATLLKTLP